MLAPAYHVERFAESVELKDYAELSATTSWTKGDEFPRSRQF